MVRFGFRVFLRLCEWLRRGLCRLERGYYFCQGQVERDPALYRRQFNEPKFFVKYDDLAVQCVHDNGARRDVSSRQKAAAHRILNKMPADLITLLAVVHRKTRKNHGRYWIRGIASET